jgi:hypothetical protein
MMLLAVVVFHGSFINATSSQSAVLRVEAPVEVDLNAITTFNISIIVENVEGLYGWELILTWAPSVVNCTDEMINYDIWGVDNFQGPFVTMPIDNLNGKYWQSLTGKPPGVPKSGTFWLVNLTFLIVGSFPASTDFIIQKAEGYEAYCLLDIDAEEIPHQYQPNHVNIIPEFQGFYTLALMILSTVSLILVKFNNKIRARHCNFQFKPS